MNFKKNEVDLLYKKEDHIFINYNVYDFFNLTKKDKKNFRKSYKTLLLLFWRKKKNYINPFHL